MEKILSWSLLINLYRLHIIKFFMKLINFTPDNDLLFTLVKNFIDDNVNCNCIFNSHINYFKHFILYYNNNMNGRSSRLINIFNHTIITYEQSIFKNYLNHINSLTFYNRTLLDNTQPYFVINSYIPQFKARKIETFYYQLLLDKVNHKEFLFRIGCP